MDFVYRQTSPEVWEVRLISNDYDPTFVTRGSSISEDKREVLHAVERLEGKTFGAIIITKNCEYNTYGAPLYTYIQQRIDALRPNMV